MAPPVLFHHHAALDHDTGGHPERAARIVAVERALAERDWLGCVVRTSPEATRTQLKAVHDRGYVQRIERFCALGGGMLDMDTVASAGSWTAALHATRRAAPARWSTRCSPARRRRARRCTAHRATTPPSTRRWGSACSTASRSP